MNIIAFLFWFLLFIVFYAYLGYGILLFFLVRLKRIFFPNKKSLNEDYEPEVTLFVAAYNEKDYIDAKVANSLELEYNKSKVRQVWVTDGSDDGTPDILKKYSDKGVEVYHEDARGGKIGAMNRGMKFVKTPIVIFSDGNTMLGKESIQRIVNLFKDRSIDQRAACFGPPSLMTGFITVNLL